jgi:S1-C subfamily serine protease
MLRPEGDLPAEEAVTILAVMEHEDDEPTRPLLPPDDRLWRHPSEVASHPLRPWGRRPTPRGWPVALLGGVIGALLASGVLTVTGTMERRTDTIRTVVQRETAPVAVPVAAGAGIVDIAEKTRPAVVEVRRGREETPSGSGVVFRSDGWIMTSTQVVDGVETVAIVMADGSAETGIVAGRDPESNVAVVKVGRSGMSTAALGSVATLRVGQVAVVVGASLSVGVVSALGREVKAPGGTLLLDMIQTDAPVQPASAGGALVDSGGGVIGITAAIDEGGYATPIDVARDVAEQLIANGRVVHAWLGVEGGDTTGGAVVRRVREGSPAANAGLAPKDVIVSIDGTTVESMTALKVVLRARRPGQAVDITYLRDGRTAHVIVTLSPRPTA